MNEVKMARSRVLSFMSGLGPHRSPNDKSDRREGSRESSRDRRGQHPPSPKAGAAFRPTPPPMGQPPAQENQPPTGGRPRASSRPMSMIGGYQPPMMPVADDTIPELAPIFTLLNSHSNKLFQEGYFLKLNDLDTHGRPYPDRLWTECFAQLVGTVLSLWDAAALDAAGDDGEVAPTFINLNDASIKMIESLPTRSGDTQPLTNVLSVSTAGKNRYLLHFSTFNALTQWTAGIRLAMFEHACLQEAYTGSLVAGKGRGLNNIKSIMERTRFKTEEWTRVRFGAGTPWRRCWCVISPPDEKELAAHRKQMKRKSAYDRSVPMLKGDIKFYDTRKITKKTRPVATIREAYSAYAIYPQSKALVDQSTLIKIEGPITIHTDPEVTSEGFVFVMPEVHPAVSGFEMMLRFLFPIWDIFLLYGRPTRLLPDTQNTQSLMFAMPKGRRDGYLEIFDVVTLINTSGSQGWSEREWKKRLRQATSQRLNRLQGEHSDPGSRTSKRRSHRNSMPSRGGIRFQDNPMRSTPSLLPEGEAQATPPPPPPHTDSAPPSAVGPFPSPGPYHAHKRSVSDAAPTSPRRPGDTHGYVQSRLPREPEASRLSFEDGDDRELAPTPPRHEVPLPPPHLPNQGRYDSDDMHDLASSDNERFVDAHERQQQSSPYPGIIEDHQPLTPVAAPPAFLHQPGAVPTTRPNAAPELRRANSRMSSTTLSQLAAAGNYPNHHGAPPGGEGQALEERGLRGVNAHSDTSGSGMTADSGMAFEGVVLAAAAGSSPNPPKSDTSSPRSTSPAHSSRRPSAPDASQQSLQAPAHHQPRSTSPLSQTTSASEKTVGPSKLAAVPTAAAAAPAIPQPPTRPSEDRPTTASSATSDPHRPSVRMPLMNSKSIARKPLQSRSPVRASDLPPRTSSVFLGDGPLLGPDGAPFGHRNSANSEAFTSDSEDYTSSRGSYGMPLPIVDRDRPRSGALRTVGEVNPSEQEVVIGDARYRPGAAKEATTHGSFSFDFGPTQYYTPGVPARKPVSNEGSPARKPTAYGHAREASNRSQNLALAPGAERTSSRPTSEERDSARRSRAWLPGESTGPDAGPGLTPEQYVQQRAAAGQPGPYAARRTSATPPASTSRHASRTPPLVPSQNSSGDWTNGRGRGSPLRPSSRGRSAGPTTDLSSHLTAREQEHVARMTGTPLLNIGHEPPRASMTGGLVGAIDAREREKQDLRNMHSNTAVQQAVAQRQSQQYRGATPTMNNVPGHFPITPQYYDGGWEEQYGQAVSGHAEPQPQEYFAQGSSGHGAASDQHYGYPPPGYQYPPHNYRQ